MPERRLGVVAFAVDAHVIDIHGAFMDVKIHKGPTLKGVKKLDNARLFSQLKVIMTPGTRKVSEILFLDEWLQRITPPEPDYEYEYPYEPSFDPDEELIVVASGVVDGVPSSRFSDSFDSEEHSGEEQPEWGAEGVLSSRPARTFR